MSQVSIHALLAECDLGLHPGFHTQGEFQSTHSLRSATSGAFEIVKLSDGFNPRTPCGVRPQHIQTGFYFVLFQSTHSLRSATMAGRMCGFMSEVSIHALLAECDLVVLDSIPACSGFNPRTPCGVRLRPTLYIATQQSKSYFAPTSLKRPSLHGCSF